MRPFLEIDNQPHRVFPRRGKCSTLYLLSPYGIPALLLILALITPISIGCNASKSSKQPTRIEGQLATVIDLTGLDGCGKLLMMDFKDQKLLPANDTDVLAPFHYGDRVVVQYTEREGMVSICMVEDIAGNITVIEKAEPLTDLNWIDTRLPKKGQRHSIYRCNDDEGDFIYVQHAIQSTLYDLKGQEVCSTKGKAMSECVRRFNASKQCLIKEGL